jgi:rare lipoprotein A
MSPLADFAVEIYLPSRLLPALSFPILPAILKAMVGVLVLAGAGQVCAQDPEASSLAAQPGGASLVDAKVDKPYKIDRADESSIATGRIAGEVKGDNAGQADVTAFSPALEEAQPAQEHALRGDASWYATRFHGRRTASGERYNKHALTAAHPTLPFGTIVQVRSLTSGREVQVRINDRGPFSRDRMIDLSQSAARLLGMLGAGVHEVQLLIVGQPRP